MAEKYKEQAVVIRQEPISYGVYSMWLKTERIAGQARPGQFLSMYCRDGSRILPRPISICEIDRRDKALRVAYRVAGKGTEEMSARRTGEIVEIAGPMGNGFPLKEKKAFLVGGGIGIPPLLQLAKELKCDKKIILGYRDAVFLKEDFRKYGEVYVATEDGSEGTEGTVMDAIRENGLDAEIIYACGPVAMLRAVKRLESVHGMECWVSLEERMACGIGACLGCVCRSKEKDIHTNVRNKRICKEGPVFRAEEVDF